MNEEEIKLISKLQENAIKYKFLKRNNVIFDMNKYYDDYVLFELIQRLKQENQQLKENNKSIMEELLRVVGLYNQQKTVLDEIRENIKEHKDYLEKAKEMYIDCEDELLKSTCIQLINNELVRNDNLLQILDKVKE